MTKFNSSSLPSLTSVTNLHAFPRLRARAHDPYRRRPMRFEAVKADHRELRTEGNEGNEEGTERAELLHRTRTQQIRSVHSVQATDGAPLAASGKNLASSARSRVIS